MQIESVVQKRGELIHLLLNLPCQLLLIEEIALFVDGRWREVTVDSKQI